MLTKSLYESKEMKIAMEKEISRAEQVLKAPISSKLCLSWTAETTGDIDGQFYNIPSFVRKRIYDLTYGTSKEAEDFRKIQIYPELFKRDDEDDDPVEIFLSAKNFGLETIDGKEGVVVSFQTTIWWDGEYAEGLPFSMIDIKASNEVPQRAKFFEPSKEEKVQVISYDPQDYAEADYEEITEENEFVEEDDDILAQMADLYCLAAVSTRRTAFA